MRPELAKSPNIAACRSAMRDVSDQGDGQAANAAAVLTNRQDIEQSLCWMIMGAVTGVQDTAVKFS